jgi:hypothetical protein
VIRRISFLILKRCWFNRWLRREGRAIGLVPPSV